MYRKSVILCIGARSTDFLVNWHRNHDNLCPYKSRHASTFCDGAITSSMSTWNPQKQKVCNMRQEITQKLCTTCLMHNISLPFLYEKQYQVTFLEKWGKNETFCSSSCFTFLSKKICQSHDWCTIAQKVYFQITTSFKINSIWNMRKMSYDNIFL